MAKAYLSDHYTFAEVGRHFGVSYATVSRGRLSAMSLGIRASPTKYNGRPCYQASVKGLVNTSMAAAIEGH